MTREQDDRIERLGIDFGRVCVNLPYSDGSVEVTAEGGLSWLLSPAGNLTNRPFNHSIDWKS